MNKMLTIKIAFEEETGLDAIDPLGDLTISDGASTIAIRTTYLDSWLAALISGYNRSRQTNHINVEVSEERQAISINILPSGLLSISYENQTLMPQLPQEVKVALKGAAQYLLRALDTLPSSHRNAFLDPIRKFISAG
jgi:hypothetical protein